jgi:hypothetical protein
MFPTVTRSWYFTFHIANIWINPDDLKRICPKSPKNIFETEASSELEDLQEIEMRNSFRDISETDFAQDINKDGKWADAFVPLAILIENQIAEGLKLDRLGLYTMEQMTSVCKTFRAPVYPHTRTDAVRADIISLYKARFRLEKGIEPSPPFKTEYEIQFPCSPTPTFRPGSVTNHLATIVLQRTPDLSYTYVPSTLKLMGGKRISKTN